MLVPERLQIETIYGCNAKCNMCALSLPAKRKKGVMPPDLFRVIVDSMAPYIDRVKKVDLFGLGEPLLDPYIFERIRYVREKGFKNLAISTNADLLDPERQSLLLETGIETIIFSIDGVEKKTHENIRRGVKFERVVENCQSIIRMRDKEKSKTRFVIRFIRQSSNENEWNQFLDFWISQISSKKNDLVIAYDVNTLGGKVFSKKDILGNKLNEKIERRPCHQVFDRLIFLKDGTVPLCCEDTPHANYIMGNANIDNPIEIFNGFQFKRVRELHRRGLKNDLDVCKECTVLYSEDNIQTYKGEKQACTELNKKLSQ